MVEINENLTINENQITQLIKVDDKYFVILTSNERIQISQEIYNQLGGN